MNAIKLRGSATHRLYLVCTRWRRSLGRANFPRFCSAEPPEKPISLSHRIHRSILMFQKRGCRCDCRAHELRHSSCIHLLNRSNASAGTREGKSLHLSRPIGLLLKQRADGFRERQEGLDMEDDIPEGAWCGLVKGRSESCNGLLMPRTCTNVGVSISTLTIQSIPCRLPRGRCSSRRTSRTGCARRRRYMAIPGACKLC